jgi:precorrin-3B synthase
VQVRNRNHGFPPPAGSPGAGPQASAAEAADACPGVLDLHEARDGLVARIRLPGGYVSAARLRGLAALASRFGDAHVDLTARGNVQIRGVAPGAAADMAQRAAAAGFLPSPAHDRARNILASPLAGLAGRPGLRAAVRRLDRAIRADPELAALPGRFLFSLDDGTGRAGLGGCDVGLRWCRPPARSGETELIVAGRHTGLHAPAARGIGHALAAARAFLRQRATAAGRMTSRVAGLPDGGAWVAAQAGGLLGGPVTDVTGRLALGPVPGGAPLAVAAAPLARLTAAQVRLVAALACPGDVARLAAAGRIVLPLAGPAAAALDRLAGAGLIAGDDHDLAAVTACAGMTCGRSLADVRSAATRLSGLAAVHWAGCDRRCGLPADAVAVVATPGGGFTLADGTAVVAAPGGGFATEGNPPGVTSVTARPA